MITTRSELPAPQPDMTLVLGDRPKEDHMPATLTAKCPLCGLIFTNARLLELHLREDHPRRRDRPG